MADGSTSSGTDAISAFLTSTQEYPNQIAEYHNVYIKARRRGALDAYLFRMTSIHAVLTRA